MRVEVDRDLCESNTVCGVREAVALCPNVALTLHDG